LEFISREEWTISPMTVIESHPTIGTSILTIPNDDEIGEKIVELFIAHAKARRHAHGQSHLCVGALASPGLPSAICVETLSSSF
jgi:hypothetical protein